MKYTIQVAPEDCTGCTLCVVVCPAKDKSNPKHKSLDMHPQRPLREPEARELRVLPRRCPEVDRGKVKVDVKGSQFFQPLFEFSGACAACGETPYVKLMTQLFGDRLLVANATGCSSIYGGNLPTDAVYDEPGRARARPGRIRCSRTTPSSASACAWPSTRTWSRPPSCSPVLRRGIGDELVTGLLKADQSTEAGIAEQRRRVVALRQKLAGIQSPEARLAREHRGFPGQEERVDRRRRRVGVRHRVRRPGPRAGDGPEREHPRARHRGVLEHGRPAVEGDADGRLRQVRDGRPRAAEEGPRHDCHGLRQRLCRPCRVRRQGRADRPGVPGSGRLRRPVDDHRVQPLHRARVRPGVRPRAAEARGRHRILAAVPVRPAAPGSRGQPAPAGLGRTPSSISASSGTTSRASASSSR